MSWHRSFPMLRGLSTSNPAAPAISPRLSPISQSSRDHLVEYSRQRLSEAKPLQEGTKGSELSTLSIGVSSEYWGPLSLSRDGKS